MAACSSKLWQNGRPTVTALEQLEQEEEETDDE